MEIEVTEVGNGSQIAEVPKKDLPVEMLLLILEKSSIEKLMEWRQTSSKMKQIVEEALTKRTLLWTSTFHHQHNQQEEYYRDPLMEQQMEISSSSAEQPSRVLGTHEDIRNFLLDRATSTGNVFPNGTLIFIPDKFQPLRFRWRTEDWIGLYERLMKVVKDHGEWVISYATEVNPCSTGYFLKQIEPIFHFENLQKLTLISSTDRQQHHHSFHSFRKVIADYPHLKKLEEIHYLWGDALYLHQNIFQPAEYRHQITKLFIKNHIIPVGVFRRNLALKNYLPPSELIPAVTKLKIAYPTASQIAWLTMSSASIREISLKCVNILKLEADDESHSSFSDLMEALDKHSDTLELICLDFGWEPFICEDHLFAKTQLDEKVTFKNVKQLLISYEFLYYWPEEFHEMVTKKFPHLEALQIINCKGKGAFVVAAAAAVVEGAGQAEMERLAMLEVERLGLWGILPATVFLIFFPDFNKSFIRAL